MSARAVSPKDERGARSGLAVLYSMLGKQRQHPRNIPALVSGDHMLGILAKGGPPGQGHSVDALVTVDASAQPRIGDVIITLPDGAYVEPHPWGPRYIVARILNVSRKGVVTVKRLDWPERVERNFACKFDPTYRYRGRKPSALFIDGVVRSARLMNAIDPGALGEFADVISVDDCTRLDAPPKNAATVTEKKAKDFQFGVSMAVAAITVLLREEHGAERERLLSAAIENLENASRLPEPRHLKLVPRRMTTTPNDTMHSDA